MDNQSLLNITPEVLSALASEIIKQLKVNYGETLVKNKGTIDVKDPVKQLITQEAFDQLNDEEKNHGIYVIPGEGGTYSPYHPEIYSEEETLIGRWIDGKPLYRRIISSTTGDNLNAKILLSIASINIDSVTTLRGTAKRKGGGWWSLPLNADRIVDLYIYNGEIRIKVNPLESQEDLYNLPVFIVLEYTKSTD